jgi:pimeloyl-ACP methyl ester carboxylesterase
MVRRPTLMLLTLLGLTLAEGASVPAPAAERGQAAEALDALTYTVVRTPPAQRIRVAPLERDRNVLVDRVRPFPDRDVPDVFWYDNAGMSYGLVYQETRAPLVFLIAGTGGSFNTDTNKLLAQTLHQEGFHVLGFPSPTHPNFIVNASQTGIPGRMPDDARDLYRAMRLAHERVKDRIEVSEVYLAGYSLGGTHAAWVAKLDEQERAIGFDKVLLLNPAVSLYNSVNALDAMYDRHVADDPAAAQALVDRTFTRFAEAYTREQDVSFDGDFLYRAYQEFQPGAEALETLIGTSFRYSLVNLAFTADVMGKGGYMVPPDAALGTTTSLTGFYKHAFRKSFVDYLDGLYLPYFQRLDPALTRERAIHEAGLLPLGDWLEGNPRIGVITNRDDIILKPDELGWLERTFGARAVVLPDGGHCGNYQRRDFADALVGFFRR